MKHRALFFCVALLPVLPGCAANAGPDTNPEYEEPAVESGKADGLKADNWTYYSVRPDFRKCMWPMCGGFWVKRVNQPKTKCPTGGWQKECYVTEIDWDAIGLSDAEASDATSAARAGQVVLKGNISGAKASGMSFDVFAADEAWQSATDAAPTGIFYRAHDSGIVCITFPCPTVIATRLNRNKQPTATYAGLDLAPSGASQGQLDGGWAQMNGDGLLVAAKVVDTSGPGGTADALEASQFYTRIRHEAVECHKTGCSSQICAEAGDDVFTTCEWLPEYACLQAHGVCEAQPDGKCGWTPSVALDGCLKSIP